MMTGDRKPITFEDAYYTEDISQSGMPVVGCGVITISRPDPDSYAAVTVRTEDGAEFDTWGDMLFADRELAIAAANARRARARSEPPTEAKDPPPTPAHPMTDEQIRDRLAEIKGYQSRRNEDAKTRYWKRKIDDDWTRTHPIPPLDSPEALAVVAGMVPGARVADEARARALAVIAAHGP